MSFFQDPPKTPDLYAADAALRSELARRVPADVLAGVAPRLEEMGALAAGELQALSERAEAEPPVHVPYDPWGRRVDEIRVSPAWRELHAFSARHGLVATGYDEALGDRARLVQAALLHLYSASSATYSCPLAMTDAAARVLVDQAPASLSDRLVPRLTSRDPERFITSGQWMTERTGGSDVGGTETVARPLRDGGGEDRYTLHGVKWFTSATTSEMALTLARIDDGSSPVVSGSRGLTMFCVEVERDASGGLRGIQVNRLKDKLGTRALPTAELTLDGVVATRIGEPGRGVPNISTMLNITRWYNAVCSASVMALGTFRARDYAERRVAFGRKLIEQPLHRRTLAAMEAEAAAALALSFEISDLLGRAERNTSAGDDELARLRGLVPIAKLALGKQAVAVASEALEAFGGAGYIEDTGLPRMLRDAQVMPIWEGTTNVLSLDLLRAETRSKAFSAVVEDLRERAGALRGLDEAATGAVRAAVGRLAERTGGYGEEEARDVALTCGFAAEAVFMGETAMAAGGADPEAPDRFRRFVRGRLCAPLT